MKEEAAAQGIVIHNIEIKRVEKLRKRRLAKNRRKRRRKQTEQKKFQRPPPKKKNIKLIDAELRKIIKSKSQ